MQKHQDDGGGSGANGLAAALAARAPRRRWWRGRRWRAASARGAAGGGATLGSVANMNGSTLYVNDADGTTVKVKTTSHSKSPATPESSVGAIHPGDTVIVQGTKAPAGPSPRRRSPRPRRA